MNESIKLAKELKEEILKEPLIVEYLRVKELVESNEEINSLKKQIALAKANKDNDLHKLLLDRYNNHPLVVNYNILKEEVNEYLLEISKIVNKKWWNSLLFYL